MAAGTGPGSGAQRGIPDGLILGVLGFLLGITLFAWTATGLAALFAHGSWPDSVTFARTPLAIRQLISAPHDLPTAWPDTPPGELSGYGLFWGLFIGELMVAAVLTVFVLGVLARWRALRTVRLREREVARERAEARAEVRAEEPVREAPPQPAPTPVPAPAAPTAAPAPPVEQAPAPTPAPVEQAPVPAPRPAPYAHVRYGTPHTRRPAAVQAIQDAEGPALVVTSDPTVWAETKDARAKLGPVLVYDPGHLCDTPARLHWSPTTGCEDADTAAARAVALLAPVRPLARLDAAMADTAETLLRCWLHAAAVDARPFKQVHRWAQGGGAHEAVRILRTHPKAASGLAGLLESALTGHPERREISQQLATRALASLSSVHIREACTPNRADSLALDSYPAEGGTLYVVGEPIEDPRTRPGAMPLLTALASSVVEHGRRMAARSSAGRLDPPMTLVLDDVAAVAPLPALPDLLADGDEQGMPALVLLRSREQGRDRWPDRWPHQELPV
ncbi:type IV secretory system conjugative DNA transfer family protein [Streptomyces sp. 4R-3d]|uniref:type IV secretory system conjugative DNA transfer family protein n=1 Tax=Streptomyces sp. 4R-3d TaxID=2559605 RepID=UPI0010720829|nr:type IV secretory system conjugative DNA transfer family protein [Streptomyces sp. 4R-3d]TFI27988.1 type VI secretion protein [Streptomyces sp. 4R-3d]